MKNNKDTTNMHTPGPWNRDLGSNSIWANEGDLLVARVADLPWVETSTGRRTSDSKTEEANARLIASAPDLLAALERAVSVLEDLPYPQGAGAREQARSAIAKSRGES